MEMSGLNATTPVSCADLFGYGIRLLRRVPIDKVVVPISVDADASLRDD